MNYKWTCNCCGKTFDVLPMDFVLPGPTNWLSLSEADRLTRAKMNSDLCIIDDKEFYVRGVIEIPVLGGLDCFRWGVWVSISRESFDRIVDLWQAEDVENEPARFAWLCNWISGYPEPDEIKCHVHIRTGSLRPLIELEQTDYPLAVEQRQGISLDRIKEIAALSLH